jgi:hypothetical protein
MSVVGTKGYLGNFFATAAGTLSSCTAYLRKRVVTRDRAAVRRQDEGNGRVLFEILARLFAKVNVQKIDAARKGGLVVLQSERRNPKRGFLRRASQLASHLFFVASCSRTSSFVGPWRVQNGIHEDLASVVMRREELELLDRVRSRLLRTGDNKLCHRKST